VRHDVPFRTNRRGIEHALRAAMSSGDTNHSERPTASCAWCGAVWELSGEAARKNDRAGAEVVSTFCPRCEADFKSLSNEPKGMNTLSPTEKAAPVLDSGESLFGDWLVRRGRRLRIAWLVVLAGLLVGCGASRPQRAWTMPSPDGCYVQVWDRPGFSGVSEFINGPRRYEHLRDLPGRLSWKGKVRSLRLGPAASGIAWTSEGFEGTNLVLATDSRQPDRFAELPMNVESLDIRCSSTPTVLAKTRSGPQQR
jgi:hypothetical protein